MYRAQKVWNRLLLSLGKGWGNKKVHGAMGVEQRWLRHLGCVVRLEDHSIQSKADTKEIFSPFLSLGCVPHYHAMLLRPGFSNT